MSKPVEWIEVEPGVRIPDLQYSSKREREFVRKQVDQIREAARKRRATNPVGDTTKDVGETP